MTMVWLRYGSHFVVSPLNCLYSACRGLLVDGHSPEICTPQLDVRAARGFFCLDGDEQSVRTVAEKVERVVRNPRRNYADASDIVTAARHHHRKGLAHVWLVSDFP